MTRTSSLRLPDPPLGGFAYEGTLRSAIAAKGRRWDIALYARPAGDPAP
jgi:hypothetical protein